MKNKSVILVVDDQPQNIELLEAYLVPQGYEIIPAASGEEALLKLVHNQIDLILLDIMMPKMSGLELLEKLRADEKTKAIPVVMVPAPVMVSRLLVRVAGPFTRVKDTGRVELAVAARVMAASP